MAAEARKKLLSFFEGVRQYALAEIPDWQPNAKIIWQQGSTKIWDYGGKGKKILVISPLINRASILDFGSSSLMHYLKEQGYNPLLVDWAEPANSEIGFGLADYTKRLAEFCKTINNNVIPVGYCMGGIIALKLAEVIKPKALVLLATPWELKNKIGLPQKSLEKYLDSVELVPAEFINSLFVYADLFATYDKFAILPELSAARKKEFFAIEKWVNSGVAMSVPLAKEFIINWGINNKMKVDFEKITCPTLVATAMQDKIVPVSSSLPLIALINNSELLKLNSGHIGILTKKLIHKPLTNWLEKVL